MTKFGGRKNRVNEMKERAKSFCIRAREPRSIHVFFFRCLFQRVALFQRSSVHSAFVLHMAAGKQSKGNITRWHSTKKNEYKQK